jgi:hypothetical protein
VELEPHHRRRCDPAGRGDGHRVGEPPRERVAVEPPTQTRDENEDRNDGRKRELEAGIEQRVRIPREQNCCADEQEVPAIGHPRGQPRQRAQRTRDAGTNHGRLRPDCENVRADARERSQLTGPARGPDEPREQERTSRDERDVLTRHRQEVVEAGGTEALPQLIGQAAVVAEHDSLEHRSAFAP